MPHNTSVTCLWIILILVCVFREIEAVKCEHCDKEFKCLARHHWRCKARVTSSAESTRQHSLQQRVNQSISPATLSSQAASVTPPTTSHQPTQDSIVCSCGRACKGRRGLAAHQRTCTVHQALLDSAGLPSEGLPSTPADVSNVNKQSADPQYSQQSVSVSSFATSINTITNTASTSTIKTTTTPLSTVPTSHSLVAPRRLSGVKLPKTDSEWSTANSYFHLEFMDLLSGALTDLDQAAERLNRVVYEYFAVNFGIIRNNNFNSNQPDTDIWDSKYGNFSCSRLQRALKGLKKSSDFIEKDSQLHKEIGYVSKLIRSKLSAKVKSVNLDAEFNNNFWSTCHKTFNSVNNILPKFSLSDCNSYFINSLSVAASAASKFLVPNWFVSPPSPKIPFNDTPPTYSEITALINKAKGSSSACPFDQISIISFKRCPILRTLLHKIITACWQKQYTPADWRRALTILIFKKGDPDKVENFRPITLQSAPYKIYSVFLRNRLQAFLDSNNYHNNQTQKGFTKNVDGVLEHSELLNFLLKDAKRHVRSIVVILLDLRNAFGEIQHELIRTSLRHHHVPDIFINSFNSIYSHFTVSVACRNEATGMIAVNKGVLQGDPCSPLLFNLCFNSLLRVLETPFYSKLGYIWGKSSFNHCNWLQYADDAVIIAKDQKSAQTLTTFFNTWCQWSKMEIRLDKCSAFGMAKPRMQNYQQILPNISLNQCLIPTIPMDGQFKYLGRLYNFKMDEAIAKEEVQEKVENFLKITTKLSVKPQTKIKLLARFLPSQISFHLKIYNFPFTWIADTLDSICIKYVRNWLEAPINSCIKEWLASPIKACGLAIPSLKSMAENLRLSKRNSLKLSQYSSINTMWAETCNNNINADALLSQMPLEIAKKHQKRLQADSASNHFTGLKVQGAIAKLISENVPPSLINLWNNCVDQLPGYLYNFTRKAIQAQLPTMDNLHRWGRAQSGACPLCGHIQSNKHVLSNCDSASALSRYTTRHNRLIELLVDWMRPKLPPDVEIYSDLHSVHTKHISDLFTSLKPDLALRDRQRVGVLELTVCHETNLITSRNFKLNKYSNLSLYRNLIIKDTPVTIATWETTTLGFTMLESKFLSDWGLPSLDKTILHNLTKSSIGSSFDIYALRNV